MVQGNGLDSYNTCIVGFHFFYNTSTQAVEMHRVVGAIRSHRTTWSASRKPRPGWRSPRPGPGRYACRATKSPGMCCTSEPRRSTSSCSCPRTRSRWGTAPRRSPRARPPGRRAPRTIQQWGSEPGKTSWEREVLNRKKEKKKKKKHHHHKKKKTRDHFGFRGFACPVSRDPQRGRFSSFDVEWATRVGMARGDLRGAAKFSRRPPELFLFCAPRPILAGAS